MDFSADRKDAGQFLSRSLFPKGLNPGMGHSQMRSITVAQDRIVFSVGIRDRLLKPRIAGLLLLRRERG